MDTWVVWWIVIVIAVFVIATCWAMARGWSLARWLTLRKPVSTAPSTVPWTGNIETLTTNNADYRRVLATGSKLQLTAMSLLPQQDIGDEQHVSTDQFLRVEQGTGRFEWHHLPSEPKHTSVLEPGSAILVPAGIWHNVVNTGPTAMKLYSLYAPPEHLPGTIEPTKP